jgi:hypothetical protein
LKQPFWSQETSQQAIEAYKAGSTLACLGVLFGCDPATVSNLLKASGIARRSPGRKLVGKPYVDAQGYRRIHDPNHPRSDQGGYVKEHISVWESKHGSTPKGWHIHHENHNKLDNRLENLRAVPAAEHHRLTMRELLTPGSEKDERVHTARIGHALFLKLFPFAIPVSDQKWFAEHDFLLEGLPVEVKTSRPYKGRCHFDTSNRAAKYHFLVTLNADSLVRSALLLETTILPSSVWLG